MRQRDDHKEDWTGNAVRGALVRAGFPSPNRRLVDTLAPVIARTVAGNTLRRWKYSSAEIDPILEEMKPLFSQIEEFKGAADSELLTALLQETSDLFHQRISELDAKKLAAK